MFTSLARVTNKGRVGATCAHGNNKTKLPPARKYKTKATARAKSRRAGASCSEASARGLGWLVHVECVPPLGEMNSAGALSAHNG